MKYRRKTPKGMRANLIPVNDALHRTGKKKSIAREETELPRLTRSKCGLCGDEDHVALLCPHWRD